MYSNKFILCDFKITTQLTQRHNKQWGPAMKEIKSPYIVIIGIADYDPNGRHKSLPAVNAVDVANSREHCQITAEM